MSKIEWTEELDQVVIEGYEGGLSFSKIGLLVGASRNAVAGRCSRLNLSRSISKKEKQTVAVEEVEESAYETPETKIENPRGAVEAILALRNRNCRFPTGDPYSPDFHFCMKTTPVGVSLCREHYALSYVKVRRK